MLLLQAIPTTARSKSKTWKSWLLEKQFYNNTYFTTNKANTFGINITHYILSHIHTPVFHWQLPGNRVTRWPSMLVALPLACCNLVTQPSNGITSIMATNHIRYATTITTRKTISATRNVPVGQIHRSQFKFEICKFMRFTIFTHY